MDEIESILIAGIERQNRNRKTTNLQLRVPFPILDILDQMVEAQGCNRSDILRQALYKELLPYIRQRKAT